MDSNLSRLKNIAVGILPTAIVLAVIVSSCGLLRFRCITYHNPILEFTVTPASDTIRVGDTLTLKIECSSLLKDWKNGDINQFNKDPIFSIFSVFKLYDTIQPPLFSDSNFTFLFDYKIEIGEVRDGSRTKQIRYETRNDSLFFELKIIPKFSGFYQLSIYNTLTGRETRGLPLLTIKNGSKDDCEHRLYSIMPNINNGNSTIDRALKKGFKLSQAWSTETNKDLLWFAQNSSYNFDVVSR